MKVYLAFVGVRPVFFDNAVRHTVHQGRGLHYGTEVREPGARHAAYVACRLASPCAGQPFLEFGRRVHSADFRRE